MKKLLASLLSIFFALTSSVIAQVVFSFASVLDYSALEEPPETVVLRNSIIAELTESYNCVVLSRSNGIALLEEQRALALSSSNPADFPYPPAADFLLITECLKETEGLRLRVSYTKMDGHKASKLETFSTFFESNAALKAQAADLAVQELAKRLDLPVRDANTDDFIPEKDIWACFSFQDLSASYFDSSELQKELTIRSSKILKNITGYNQVIEPAADPGFTIFNGASETHIATVGRSIGAELILTGSVYKTAENLTVQLLIVRSQDAAVLAAREFILEDESDLERYLEISIHRMTANLKGIALLPESSAEANVEEAETLFHVAENMQWGMVGKLWQKTQALELYLSARMVAQDTYFEENALSRIPVLIFDHPNLHKYHENWQAVGLQDSEKNFNDYVIQLLKSTLINFTAKVQNRIMIDAYTQAGYWDKALELTDQMICEDNTFSNTRDRAAASYLSLLSLSGRNAEAIDFYASLDDEIVGNFVLMQAAYHFRRIGNESMEASAYKRRLQTDNWQTWDDFARVCYILEKHFSAEQQIELLNKLEITFRTIPIVQWHLIKAEMALGQTESAQMKAVGLLKRKSIGSGSFPSEPIFRAEIRNIAGEIDVSWPTAAEVRSIPSEYKMYLQPAGDVDVKLIEAATAIAADFFGCEFIIRPTIPTPKSQLIYPSDLTYYKSVPLLRHLVSARPAPRDAIHQLFIVDRHFYYNDDPESTYKLGLGAMITTASVQRQLPNRRKANRLAAMIIRSFRHYVECSQNIFPEESPDNKPCVNARERVKIQPEMGYCPECVKNYESADWKIVHAFVQSFPLEIAFEPDYTTDQHSKITEEEKDSIKNYVNELQVAYH